MQPPVSGHAQGDDALTDDDVARLYAATVPAQSPHLHETFWCRCQERSRRIAVDYFRHYPHEVDDATSEATIRLVERVGRGLWDSTRPFAPWANTVIRNFFADRLERLGRVQRVERGFVEEIAAEPPPQIDGECLDCVRSVFERCSENESKIICLYYDLDVKRTAADVAEELAVSLRTLMYRKSAILAKAKAACQEHCSDH